MLFGFASQSFGEEKFIRLRNELIATTPDDPNVIRLQALQPPVSGLFLVQFREPLQPAWREQLQAEGVELLRYVPDDAFVARFTQAPLDRIRGLPFIQWAGLFRSAHKLAPETHPARLAEPLVSIRVLLSPDAGAQERAGIHRAVQAVQNHSPLRFGDILDAIATPAEIELLSQSPNVLWIEASRAMRLFDEISSKITAGDDGLAGTPALAHQLGFDGSGVVVAVVDSGLDSGEIEFMHPDLAGRVDALFHYGTLEDAADEHGHGTHVAGIVAGNAALGETDRHGHHFGLGVAPGARIIGQRMFDGAGGYHPPPSMETLTRDAVRAGAHIGSNSWGDDTQGRYDLFAAEFDALVRDADFETPGDQPFILEFSAGNAGPGEQSIGTPALAKNVIATGAVENNRFDLPLDEFFTFYDSGQETMADFSSRGPTEDGRIKPDVVAPGTWIASLRSIYANDDFVWWPISGNYTYQGGTSQAGPHVSGAAAVFVQWYRETVTNALPSPALVKAAIIDSAVKLDDGSGTTFAPNHDEGWGRVDLTQIIGSPRRHEFIDQTTAVSTGQTFEHRIFVASRDEPLKVTMTYTDVPGFPGAVIALVNDLDLEVTGPDGALYRGNQFANGESAPGAPSADRINNVEGVHLRTPLPGEYVVRVRARNVVEDARRETPSIDQDFALVVSADLLPPLASAIYLDRRAYTAPSQIRIGVIHPQRAGLASLAVTVASATEPLGESITLLASGPTGVFTGAVATATGPAIADGVLQISHGDTIEARYFDAAADTTRTALARADLVPPVLANVTTQSAFGQTAVTWTSDEPATSVVRYGTTSSLGSTASNSVLATQHSIVLRDLEGNQTYYFHVSSADEAGNTATNDNGGALFSFLAVPAATLLLVDSYTDPFFGAPPLSGYTDPLTQLNINFELWRVADLGSPPLETLLGYQAVIWRVDEFFSVWTSAQRQAISTYLDSGGALMVASMELLSRLEAAGANDFILNVLRVQSFTHDENGSTGAGWVTGELNDPLGNGIDLATDFRPYEELWGGLVGPDISDTLLPAPNASGVFRNEFQDIIGLRWPAIGSPGAGRLVFLSFPFDAVPMGGGANDRIHLLRNIISFLVPGLDGLGTVALNAPAYGIPSAPFVEVADSDLAGMGAVQVTAHSDTHPSGVTVTLNETVRPGVFNGLFEIIAAGQPPAPGRLPGAHNDGLWVDYLDQSAARTARAAARIDTVPPALSFVQTEPGYLEAIVSWNTSEPTDGLVQFGESPFLERTAYDPARRTTHEILVSGLLPNRTYYFRVVSRDAAGNTGTDDNNGELYTFQTLTPVGPPWLDDFESGTGSWLVIDGEDSQSTWRLGTPNNRQETAARSPVNAWGTNLDGRILDYSETVLLSAAIDLTGGSRAELRFWHSYDISENIDVLEAGFVEVYTNLYAQATTVATFQGTSPGWEEEVIDLSAFAGGIVYLAWHYIFLNLTFDHVAPPGWLIDDVSVTLSGTAEGTIQITNNLAQAAFTLTGPASQTGAGWNTVVSNAPPGEYTVTFHPVPFHTTPAPQTKTLGGPSMSLSFSGAYTFADANNNGISDEWEEHHFGSVSSERDRFTDSDGDGAADYEEFIAGTDPGDPESYLSLDLSVTGAGIQLEWNSAPGRAYRLVRSSDLETWQPASPWFRAEGTATSVTLPHEEDSSWLFRLEVRP